MQRMLARDAVWIPRRCAQEPSGRTLPGRGVQEDAEPWQSPLTEPSHAEKIYVLIDTSDTRWCIHLLGTWERLLALPRVGVVRPAGWRRRGAL